MFLLTHKIPSGLTRTKTDMYKIGHFQQKERLL